MRHAIALFLLCATLPAWAQECGPLKEVASIDAQPLGDSSVLTVPAGFNGTQKRLLVNTGAGISTLQDGALAELGLHAIQNSKLTMLSGSGTASRSFVETDFTLGAIHAPRMQFQVMPVSPAGTAFIGSLAGDVLSLYDVEVDPAGRKLNLFAHEHCPGHVLYWHPSAVAVLPIQTQLATGDRSRNGYYSYVQRAHNVYVPVTLDGKNFQALVNTGSGISSMSAKTAKFVFGVSADSPGAVVQPASDGDPAHASFTYTFPTLTFDTVTVTNARFLIYPDLAGSRDPDNSIRTDSRIHRIDDNITTGAGISIGMDVLKKLRLFIAFSESKLYITPATAPAATQ